MEHDVNHLLTGISPVDGTALPPGRARISTDAEVTAACEAAAAAAPVWGSWTRSARSAALESVGDAIDSAADRLLELAYAETDLPRARLRGELARTAYQARFLAAVVNDAGHLDATVDHARESPMGPLPDLRSMRRPIGPVAVFGASNFPFAFSVIGGDVMSALAAGCPVVIKAHPSHPETSVESFEVLSAALTSAGAPAGTVGLVAGSDAGLALVAAPQVRAVAFTGSPQGARALGNVIAGREDSIPFYAELASINPVIVTSAAAQSRADTIAEQVAAAVTFSSGQLCTKPGVVLVPDDPAGAHLVQRMRERVLSTPAMTVLNERVHELYLEGSRRLLDAGAHVESAAVDLPPTGWWVRPELVEVTDDALTPELLSERFGPVSVIVRYDPERLDALVSALPGSLTASLYAEPNEIADLAGLVDTMTTMAGRVLFDAMPTGVAVGWAQTHGGPWPAATTPETSVGAASVGRFVRPVTWQNAPQELLPPELRDGPDLIPRRVDGVLRLATNEQEVSA